MRMRSLAPRGWTGMLPGRRKSTSPSGVTNWTSTLRVWPASAGSASKRITSCIWGCVEGNACAKIVSKMPSRLSFPSRDTLAASARSARVTSMLSLRATPLLPRLGLALGARRPGRFRAGEEPRQRARERLAREAALGHDRGDELAGRHVEGRIRDAHATRRDLPVEDVRHLARRALLDRDALAARALEVDRGERGSDVERDRVAVREHREPIGADLVRDVAVRRGAIGANDHAAHATALHHVPRHVVGDDGDRDVVLLELPCREPRALKERTRLARDHLDALPVLDGGADDAEGRAVAGGGERARVAVGH